MKATHAHAMFDDEESEWFRFGQECPKVLVLLFWAFFLNSRAIYELFVNRNAQKWHVIEVHM